MICVLALIASRPGGHLLGRPAAATCSDCHAPAASLGTAYAGPRRGAGRKGIAAGANRVGAARYFPAPSALPRVPPVATLYVRHSER